MPPHGELPTPPPISRSWPGRSRRPRMPQASSGGVDAAVYHFDAGDAARSFDLAGGNDREWGARSRPSPHLVPAGSDQLARPAPRPGLCEQALEEAGGEPTLSAAVLEHLAWVGIYRGDLIDAAKNAKASTEHARRITDLTIRGDAMSTFGMVEFLLGRPAEGPMHEAVRLQDLAMTQHKGVEATGYTPSRACYGLQLLWAGHLDASRDVLQQELAGFEERGRYLVRDELLCYLAEVECRAGNWDVAARYAGKRMRSTSSPGASSGGVTRSSRRPWSKPIEERWARPVETPKKVSVCAC